MSFLCKSCGQLFGEDIFIPTYFIPALKGRVCEDCHDQIHDVMDELSKKGRFTMVDDDGNILSIVLDIMQK